LTNRFRYVIFLRKNNGRAGEIMVYLNNINIIVKISKLNKHLSIPKKGRVSERLIANLISLLRSNESERLSYVYKEGQPQELVYGPVFHFPPSLTGLCKGPITIEDEKQDYLITSGGDEFFCIVYSRTPLHPFWECDYFIADGKTKTRIDSNQQIHKSKDTWFHPGHQTPILDNVPYPFSSAAFIFSPFIEIDRAFNTREDNPLTVREIEEHGKGVSWSDMIKKCGFDSIRQMVDALNYRIALGDGKELYERLEKNLSSHLHAPNEDNFSELLIRDFLKLMASKGAVKAKLTVLTKGTNSEISLIEPTEKEIEMICSGPCTIIDENYDFMFTCFFDLYSCILYTRDEKIEELVKPYEWEMIICDEHTKNWWEGK